MAYLDIDYMFAAPVRSRAADAIVVAEATGFSAIEWSVIAVSKRDSLSSLSEPSRTSRAIGSLFGFGTTSRLADPRLEALRRLAVHAWRRGYALPQAEIDQFVEAGFTLSQAETLVASVTGDRVGLTQIYANPRIAA
ncbi:MAG: hypothetical protein JWN66_4929 [Sphingomonas bacterium]|uniref:hypothetical protein n=1 Tax=Sphingomonas bacterium TaxID=1895847 RepID=UPI0026362502|nr:hypothetical protein [Sphingomonas bacterium]MDB5707813.1 hypothetical protein [Sphingomonas bacterium]